MPGTAAGADQKRAAIDQWTADPCESHGVDGVPGTRAYFQGLLRKRAAYGPWLPEALDYSGAHGMDVLDVGCGQGIDLANYASNGARVAGVDLTPRHVELARAHLAALTLEATVVEGDAESLPFPDCSFDRVSSNGVLHHTPDMPKALREIHRVLRPGGIATVIVYNRRSLHYWLEQVLHRGILRRELFRERSMGGVLSSGVERSSAGGRPLVRVYSPRQLRRMLAGAGFTSVATEVRHFLPEDTFLTASLRRRGLLRRRATCERIGRVAGWYVVGRGIRPA